MFDTSGSVTSVFLFVDYSKFLSQIGPTPTGLNLSVAMGETHGLEEIVRFRFGSGVGWSAIHFPPKRKSVDLCFLDGDSPLNLTCSENVG